MTVHEGTPYSPKAKRCPRKVDWGKYKPMRYAADMGESAQAKALRLAFLSGRLKSS
jgi:hypothetical protein